jgi:hypothetical protein
MKLDSPIFDRIRVKPEQERTPRAAGPACDHPGCRALATHRAPKGRTHEQEYWRFCLDHVRAYNQSYNYFAGMSQDDVLAYQRDAVIGHRPTWKMGFNGDADRFDATDPLDLIREFGPTATRARHERKAAESSRPIHNAERRAFGTLDLEIDASPADIKARFKELVKRHHPDANGGDQSSQDRLVEVIQAYNYLKSAKFC